MSIILLPQTHIKWMKKTIMKGHVGRGFTLYADERYLRTAMMWSMDVTFADDDMRREGWDAEWALHYQLIESYIQMRRGNWSRHFRNAVLSNLVSPHTGSCVTAKQIAQNPALIEKLKTSDSRCRGL